MIIALILIGILVFLFVSMERMDRRGNEGNEKFAQRRWRG
jgi:hypothetical protein